VASATAGLSTVAPLCQLRGAPSSKIMLKFIDVHKITLDLPGHGH